MRLQSDGRKAVTFPVTPRGDNGFTANVPVHRLAPGTWTVSLWLPSQRGEGWSMPVILQPGLKSTRWYRGGLPRYASPAKHGTHALRVGRVALVKTGIKRLRALRNA